MFFLLKFKLHAFVCLYRKKEMKEMHWEEKETLFFMAPFISAGQLATKKCIASK